MKFPISVTGKKPQKHSVNDENNRNKANMIHSSEEKISTQQKTTSILLQKPKSLWSSDAPEMAHATTASESVCNSATSEMCVRTDNVVCEQSQKDLGLSSESRGDDISLIRRGSLEDEGVGHFESYEEEDDDIRPCSRASSLYDDSGFNSSASEDRDDDYSLSNVNYDCDFEDEAEEQELPFEDCQNAQTFSMLDSVSEESGQRKENVCTKMSSDPRSASESSLSNEKSNVELNLDSSKSILVKDLKRHSKKQRTVETNASANINSAARPRTTQRCRTRDCNNNVKPKDFRSYLASSPFRLGDCFRGQGILSFVVCIAYTLFLVFLFGALGLLADLVKSFFGKKELKEMRNLRQSSRRRLPVNCG